MNRSLRRKLRQVGRIGVLSAEERARQILDERTERLATRSDLQAALPEEAPRVLVCGVGSEHFAIPLEDIVEVLPDQDCMPVPDAPPAMVGVFGRGGRLVSVIDLAVALSLEPGAAENGAWHFVLLRQEQPQVALRVSRALTVSEIAPLAEGETGAFRNDAVTGYAKALSGGFDGEKILSLLDTSRLLRPFLPSSPVAGV